MKNGNNIIKISKYLLFFMIIQIILISLLIINRVLIGYKIVPDNIFSDSSILYIIIVFFIGFISYILFRDLHLIYLLNKQYDMQKEAIENIESLNVAMRSQRHDFLNHIQIVYSLVEMKEYDEVIHYLNQIYGSIEILNNFIKTKDAAINALLRAKSFDAKRKGIEYKLNILSNLDRLSMPSWEICRCIGNLLDNAIFAAKDYSGEKSIEVYIRETISEFEFSVENSGEVIAQENITKIFNPGFTTKRQWGDGIGLYNVKQIVENYDGSVSVVSVDHRTCFTIKLPKALNNKSDSSD